MLPLSQIATMETADVENWLSSLSSQELSQLTDQCQDWRWIPNPGPQTDAYLSEADVLFYGGAAGGGKSDLLLGLAVNEHERSIIFRREYPQLRAIEDRLLSIIPRRTYNMQLHVGRLTGDRTVEFGACQRLGDEQKYQGRPHDFLGFDEITHFLKAQFIFLKGWLRSVKVGQRTRIVCAGNPPTTAEGNWVTDYFRAWLDPAYPNPAAPGELRYFWPNADGEGDHEVEAGYSEVVKGELFFAESRTFIPARLSDNAYLKDTKYGSNLNMMPEPLRSQLLYGDFNIKSNDDPWQLIPTDWVVRAQARWSTSLIAAGRVEQIGCDVARGGSDQTVLYRRYQNVIYPAIAVPGRKTPDSDSVVTLLLQAIPKDTDPLIAVDAIGVGTAVIDALKTKVKRLAQLVGSNKCIYMDKTRKFKFVNMRAYWYWSLREALDPEGPNPLALPPEGFLVGDLTAMRWKMTPAGIQCLSKDDVKEILGRSPDYGDALAYATAATVEAGQGILDYFRGLVTAEEAKRIADAAEVAKKDTVQVIEMNAVVKTGEEIKDPAKGYPPIPKRGSREFFGDGGI